MPDQLDVILNFLTQYDGSGAKAAQSDLEAINKAQGGKTDTSTVTPKPILDTSSIQTARAQVQGLASDTKGVVDKFSKIRDAAGNIFVPGDAERIHKTFTEIDKAAEGTKKLSDETKNAGEQIQNTGKVMSETYPNSAREIEELSRGIDNNVSATQRQVDASNDLVEARRADVATARTQVMEYRTLQRAGSMMTQIGTTFFVPAVAALTGASLLASNYIKNATQATALTTSWKSATDSLSYSQSRVGETIARIELPALQEAARIMDKVASFAESNPGAIKAGLGIAATVAGVAGLTMLLGKGITLYADVKYITATFALLGAENALTTAVIAQQVAVDANTAALLGKGATEVATGAGLGTAAVAGGSLLAPLTLGVSALVGEGVYAFVNHINLITEAEHVGVGSVAAMATGLGALIELFTEGKISVNKFGEVFKKNVLYLGGLIGLTGETPTVPVQNQSWYKQGFTDFQNYQKQLIDAQKQYDDAMAANDEQANAQILQINENFNQSRIRQERDRALSESRTLEDFNDSQTSNAAKFNQQSQEEEANYYKQRMDAARQYGIDVARAEEDHQKEMRRLSEDHNDTMRDLTANRDALGMIREVRSYEKARSRAEEDYTIAARRRSEDYANQMAQMENNFADQRAQKIADFAQQQADAKASFDKAKARRDEDYKQQQTDADADRIQQINQIITSHNQKMDQLAQNLQDENTLAQTAFVDRINALDGFVGATTAAYLAGLTKQYNAFADWLAQTEGIGKEAKPQASGGYAYPGITYQRAEQGTEFVLNNRTTRFAEQAIGGHLTQDRLMASLFGGGGKSSKDTYHFNNMTSDDIAAINANMRMVAREEIQRELR